MNLAQRFVTGSVFVSIGQFSSNAVNLGMQLVIARLLGPAEFGVYAFCFAITEFISILGSFSLSYALVQAEEARQEDLDTAFTISLVLGLVAIGVALALSPWIGTARSTQAAGILFLMCTMRMLMFVSQIPEAVLERSLRFRALTLTRAFATVVPNVVAVGLAWAGLGAWSLGIRDVLMGTSLVALCWAFSGYRFRARLSRSAWTKLMDYARPMFASRTIEILMERLDALAVATLLGNRAAGLYHQARFLSEAGFVATRPLERVAFIFFARVRNDPERLARGWALTNYFLLRVMLTGASALLLFPEQVVLLLLGEDWIDTAPLLRWLALYGALFPIFHNVKNLFYGLGEVARMVRVRIAQAVVFIAGVGYASFTGELRDMAIAVLVALGFALAYGWWRTRDLVESPPAARLARPFATLALTVIVVTGAMRATPLGQTPELLQPFIAPVAMAVLSFVLEPRRLPEEIRYLWQQLRAS